MMKIGFCIVNIICILLVFGCASLDRISAQKISGKQYARKSTLTLGAVIIQKYDRTSKYNKIINDTLEQFGKDHPQFLQQYRFGYHEIIRWQSNPNPQDILHSLCHKFLPKNVPTLFFIFTADIFSRRSIAFARYFFQLATYLGIPVISWFPENPALEQVPDGLTVQLAPSIRHQVAAMLDILQRYGWSHFSVVRTQFAGHEDFYKAVVDLTSFSKFVMLSDVRVRVTNVSDIEVQLSGLVKTETRIILLYCDFKEAVEIFEAAKTLKLTGKLHLWILSQSVIGNVDDFSLKPYFERYPVGTLGVYFEVAKKEKLAEELATATKVFANAVWNFGKDFPGKDLDFSPRLSCYSGSAESKWSKGNHFYRLYLTNVSFAQENDKPNISFDPNGGVTTAELEVRNLDEDHEWIKIGSWAHQQLTINEIIWPGRSHIPPQGYPEKFHVHVTFLEEPLFVNIEPQDPVTGNCTNRGVRCQASPKNHTKYNGTVPPEDLIQCCSGLCIDLLQMLAKDMKFTYDLIRVEDGLWGSEVNGSWNGLIAELINRKTDVVITALKINSERQSVVDFSVPFMQTGIAIAVAKRTGIISPKAFLDPFDTTSWLLIGVVGIQFAALSIFAFEWLSPYGYDRKFDPPSDRRFSLCRTYWLVWAMLFGAAVEVDCPKGYTARFMANVWAMFAVVFLAIYTAKLTAVMITREEFFQFTGIDDPRLQYPLQNPTPFRFGTIPFGNTEAILKRNYPKMHKYMLPHNHPTVLQGVRAVKQDVLDAFIYDAVVLDYLASQDEQCRLLTVGSWYAMTGYGIAFPRNSKHYTPFNDQLLIYRENGDLERLQKFWMAGTCKSKMETKLSIEPLSLDQFMSAFVLLGCGLFLAVLLFAAEFCYSSICRKRMARKPRAVGFSALVSMGLRRMMVSKNLSKRYNIESRKNANSRGGCSDPLCEQYLVKTTAELDEATDRINRLEQELQKAQQFSGPVPQNYPVYLLQTNFARGPSAYHDGIYQPVSTEEEYDRTDYETAL